MLLEVDNQSVRPAADHLLHCLLVPILNLVAQQDEQFWLTRTGSFEGRKAMLHALSDLPELGLAVDEHQLAIAGAVSVLSLIHI